MNDTMQEERLRINGYPSGTYRRDKLSWEARFRTDDELSARADCPRDECAEWPLPSDQAPRAIVINRKSIPSWLLKYAGDAASEILAFCEQHQILENLGNAIVLAEQ